MSHKHTHKEKSSNDKHALEAIQENKEAMAEARAELLAHNPALKIHNSETDNQDNESSDTAKNTGYIKRAEDLERIVQNNFRSSNTDSVTKENTSLLQSQLRQLFTLQFQAMEVFMESWSNSLESLARATSCLHTSESGDKC